MEFIYYDYLLRRLKKETIEIKKIIYGFTTEEIELPELKAAYRNLESALKKAIDERKLKRDK